MAMDAIQMDFTAEEEEELYDEFTGPVSSAKGAPVYGLLSKTLIHSPVVKKILPARIRRQDLNDVVFIGVRTGSSVFGLPAPTILVC